MGDSNLGDIQSVDQKLDEILSKGKLDDLGNFISEKLSHDPFDAWDILPWLFKKAGDTGQRDRPDFVEFLCHNISLASEQLSYKEFLLVIVSELEFNSSLEFLLFCMPFVDKCVDELSVSDFLNLDTIFKRIEFVIKNFTNSGEFESAERSASFMRLVRHLSEMFAKLFTPEAEPTHTSLFTANLLFYFSHVLYFAEITDTNRSIFANFLSALFSTGVRLHTELQRIHQLASRCPDFGVDNQIFTEEGTALLHVLGYRLTSGCMDNFWPSVITPAHEFQLYTCLAAILVQHFVRVLEKPLFPAPLELKQLVRTQEHLMTLCANFKGRLPLSWWTLFPRALVTGFESISKHPLSTQEMPMYVKNCISAIEALLASATISARCELFSVALKHTFHPFHCGLRAHIVVLFKNFLHETLLKLQASSLADMEAEEASLGESTVTFPWDTEYLSKICKSIFVFPIEVGGETVLDQFSWIMAALNLILYVDLRAMALLTSPTCSDDTKRAIRQVVKSFCREGALKTRFLEPVDKAVAALSKDYQKAQFEYSQKPDPTTIAPNAPTEEQCELRLLRLRLLVETLSRVSAFPTCL